MTRAKYDAKFCVEGKYGLLLGRETDMCCATTFWKGKKLYSLGGCNSSCRYRTVHDQERKEKDWNLCWSVL